MSKLNHIKLIFLMQIITLSKGSWDTELLEGSFYYMHYYARTPTGQYLDHNKVPASSNVNGQVSNAATGWGLVSLAIGAELGYISKD